MQEKKLPEGNHEHINQSPLEERTTYHIEGRSFVVQPVEHNTLTVEGFYHAVKQFCELLSMVCRDITMPCETGCPLAVNHNASPNSNQSYHASNLFYIFPVLSKPAHSSL